jgi:RecA-family ATPase
MGGVTAINRNVTGTLTSLGLRVFPLPKNKKAPPPFRFYEIAATDTRLDPDSHNIGVATGDGYFVLDFDVKPDLNVDALPVLEAWDALGLPHSLRVRTPGGGVHVYLATETPVANAQDLANYKGVDVRGHHGFTVAPGSTTPQGAYTILGPVPRQLATAPQFILDLLAAPREKDPHTATPAAELDTAPAIASATHYLLNTADEAIEGQGGDLATFRVAARTKDFGLTAETTLALMLEHWNGVKASPPWDPSDLEKKVDSAYRSGTSAPGAKSPEAEFSDKLSDDDLARIEETRLKYQGAAQAYADRKAAEHQARETAIRSDNSGYFTAAALAGQPIPPRLWVVPDLVPDRTVTILGGDGGTGKSLIALQLAAAVATNSPWLGIDLAGGEASNRSALFISAEDDADELHRRIADVATAVDPQNGLSALANLHLRSLAGHDAILATPEGLSNVLVHSALFENIRAFVSQTKPRVVVLDTLADLFGGDENNRSQARQFIGLLRGVAIDFECAVVLLAHPSRSGMATRSGDSGSTAWNASVRSRLYLERIVSGEGSERYEPDVDLRVLSTKKSNYAKAGVERVLRWKDGVFVPEQGVEMVGRDDLSADAHAEGVVVGLIARYASEGRSASPAEGVNFAPKVFAAEPEAAGMGRARLLSAMNRLFADGRIEVVEVGPPSRRKKELRVVERRARGNIDGMLG